MAKNKSFSNLLRENLNLEGFKVENMTSNFGVAHSAGSTVYDKTAKKVYTILRNTTPKDTLLDLFNSNDLATLSSTAAGGMTTWIVKGKDSTGADITIDITENELVEFISGKSINVVTEINTSGAKIEIGIKDNSIDESSLKLSNSPITFADVPVCSDGAGGFRYNTLPAGLMDNFEFWSDGVGITIGSHDVVNLIGGANITLTGTGRVNGGVDIEIAATGGGTGGMTSFDIKVNAAIITIDDGEQIEFEGFSPVVVLGSNTGTGIKINVGLENHSIKEEYLKGLGTGVTNQVLASDGAEGFTWINNSGGGGMTSFIARVKSIGTDLVINDGEVLQFSPYGPIELLPSALGTGGNINVAIKVDSIDEQYLKGLGVGTSGQILSSDGVSGFKWINSGGGGGMTSFDLEGDNGIIETITDGRKIHLKGSTGIEITVDTGISNEALAVVEIEDNSITQEKLKLLGHTSQVNIPVCSDGSGGFVYSSLPEGLMDQFKFWTNGAGMDINSQDVINLIAGTNITLTGTGRVGGGIDVQIDASGGSGGMTSFTMKGPPNVSVPMTDGDEFEFEAIDPILLNTSVDSTNGGGGMFISLKTNAITDSYLKGGNGGVLDQILASDGADGFKWINNTSSGMTSFDVVGAGSPFTIIDGEELKFTGYAPIEVIITNTASGGEVKYGLSANGITVTHIKGVGSGTLNDALVSDGGDGFAWKSSIHSLEFGSGAAQHPLSDGDVIKIEGFGAIDVIDFGTGYVKVAIKDNSIDDGMLKGAGSGNVGNYLKSDGAGGFSWDTTVHNFAKPEPISPDEGDVYFDVNIKKLRCWDGTQWNNLW